jgi:hypothetical protein
MPPRYAYWTILVDDQPTAFRAGSMEDLMPTFKRLKEKHPSAKMMWFQNAKLWNSRIDAQEAMRARGEMGRRSDFRQGGGSRDRNTFGSRPPRTDAFKPSKPGTERPVWTPKQTDAPKLEWQPKPPSSDEPRPEKLDWKPRSENKEAEPPSERRPARKPQARDKNWRPGGEHRDPRQKYKDAKKAKWQRFKKQVRSRWETKQDKEAKPRWEPKGDPAKKPDRPRWEPKHDSNVKSDRPRWEPKRDSNEKSDRPRWEPKRDSNAKSDRPRWEPKRDSNTKSDGPRWEAKRDSNTKSDRPRWEPKHDSNKKPDRPRWEAKKGPTSRPPFKRKPRPDTKKRRD